MKNIFVPCNLITVFKYLHKLKMIYEIIKNILYRKTYSISFTKLLIKIQNCFICKKIEKKQVQCSNGSPVLRLTSQTIQK